MTSSVVIRVETFPPKVWEQTQSGKWFSRRPTYYDHWRRRIRLGGYFSRIGKEIAEKKAVTDETQKQIKRINKREARWNAKQEALQENGTACQVGGADNCAV